MTEDAKALIADFYGVPAHYSYWNGCSTGGRQGLMEAQRFPNDYDGIIAGDPPNFFTHLMFAYIWPEVVGSRYKANSIPSEKFALVQQAATNACDALDGITDGIIDDPRRCHFAPKTLQCREKDSPDCLTTSQAEAVQQLYVGPRNPRTGGQIFPSLEPGSSPDPAVWSVEVRVAASFFQNVLFPYQNWNITMLDFDSDVRSADRMYGQILNAVDPNLQQFKQHGGKLIIYHGWYDPFIAPADTVNYYENVVAAMGGELKTEDFARLFMVPGMAHCGGGPGASSFDLLSAIDDWVENSQAPDKITASRVTNGDVEMTRPLCPYPEIARWVGTGSTNNAANFSCVKEK